jgi:hypothetical protein
MYVDTRLRTPSALLRTQFAGGYRHQFAQDAGGDETSVSSLFVGFEQPEHGFSGSLGRRSRSSGGVLGRYDGAELAFRGNEWWEIGVLAGMPVDSSSWSGIETDRFVGGLELELGSFFGALDVELFGVAQTAGSLLDRAAVGSEIRFFRDGVFAAGFLDYDVYYRSLNVVQLTGSWQATPSTTLTAFFDYRNVPFLTTRNALVGQDGGLGGLRELFSDAEIEALAKDRTLRATTLNLGISHRLRPDLQLAFDFTTSDFSGSEASGGVEAFEGTGFDFSYLAQVMATNLLVPGSIGVASLRYLDATSDTLVFGLQARVPVGPALRVNPRFFTVYRNGDAGLDQLALRPSLRLDYRLWKLAFDVEGGFEWARDLGGGMDPPWGYFVTAGARYDF